MKVIITPAVSQMAKIQKRYKSWDMDIREEWARLYDKYGYVVLVANIYSEVLQGLSPSSLNEDEGRLWRWGKAL